MLPSKGDILCMGGLAFAVMPGNSSYYRSLSNTICTGDELCLLHPAAFLEWPVCYKGQPCQAVFVWKTVNLSLEEPHSQKWYIQVNLRETYICGNVFEKNSRETDQTKSFCTVWSVVVSIKGDWKLLKYQKVKRGSTCTKVENEITNQTYQSFGLVTFIST